MHTRIQPQNFGSMQTIEKMNTSQNKKPDTVQITEDEILGSSTVFETTILNGQQFYVLSDPVACHRWWVYFWKLKFDQSFNKGPSFSDLTLPVQINLNTMELLVPPNLAHTEFKHLFFLNVSLTTLLILYAVFVGFWMYFCPFAAKCQVKAPHIKPNIIQKVDSKE